MPTLHELQLAFARAIDGDPGTAAPYVRDDALDAATRLGLYANNVRATFRAALALSYPAVLRLGGDAWFAGAARAYRRASPSRSGDLHPAAAAFPAFLARELAGTGLDALADVARLEWACEEAATAADAPALDLDALARVSADAHAALVFALHPSCRLVESAHPIVDLWAGESGPDAQHALVHRVGLEVRVRRLDASAHAFVAAVARGATLAASLDAANAGRIDGSFDLAATLTTLAREGALAGFTLRG